MESTTRLLMSVARPAAIAAAVLIPVCTANAQTTVGIEIEGHFTTYVTGAVGIGSESEVIEMKAVDEFGQEVVRKLPGRLSYLDITTERGLTPNTDLADWRKLVEDGNVEGARANVLVTVFDLRLDPIAMWSGTNCWPSKIENLLPDPASSTGEPVEKLVIVCEGLERTQ